MSLKIRIFLVMILVLILSSRLSASDQESILLEKDQMMILANELRRAEQIDSLNSVLKKNLEECESDNDSWMPNKVVGFQIFGIGLGTGLLISYLWTK